MVGEIGINAFTSTEDETRKSGLYGTEETDKAEMSQHVEVQRGNGAFLLKGEQLLCDKTAVSV